MKFIVFLIVLLMGMVCLPTINGLRIFDEPNEEIGFKNNLPSKAERLTPEERSRNLMREIGNVGVRQRLGIESRDSMGNLGEFASGVLPYLLVAIIIVLIFLGIKKLNFQNFSTTIKKENPHIIAMYIFAVILTLLLTILVIKL